MRYGIATPINWEYLGAELANSDSVDQILFFKAFLKECNGWGTKLQVEKQLCEITHRLTDEEKDQLAMLSYKEE